MHLLIADDHEISRLGAEALLRKAYPEANLVSVSGFEEVFEQMQACAWDCVILDLNMSGKDGLHAIRELCDQYPLVSFLVMSMHDENLFGYELYSYGVLGYVSKSSAAQDLVRAIDCVRAGKLFFNPQLEGRIQGGKTPQQTTPLSPRETEVVRLMGKGHTMKEVAQRLEISPGALSSYKKRIHQKLLAQSDMQIIQYAKARGLK